MPKPFDPALHQRYDDAAKTAVSQYLYVTEGINALEGSSVFGVDLVDDHGQWHEVEVKAGWRDQPFPFKTVHIMARKLRLFEERSAEDGYFWVLNSVLSDGGYRHTRALRIPAWCVEASPVVIAANKYMSREEVCDVPAEYATEIIL